MNTLIYTDTLPKTTAKVSSEQSRKEKVLNRLASDTGYSIETLNMFAKISDPANKQHFSIESALKAFEHIEM